MLFDVQNDKSEMYDLSRNKELLEEYGDQFIDHLIEENHEHVNKDRSLLNKNLPKPSLRDSLPGVDSCSLRADQLPLRSSVNTKQY